MLETQKKVATKAFYATIGAPVVGARWVKTVSGELVDYGPKLADEVHEAYDEWAVEGEKVAKRVQDRKVVEEFQNRVDLDKVQDRVEKLRDQLEGALHNWRESFQPGEKMPEKAVKVPVTKAEPKHVGGGWYELPDGTRVRGKEAAMSAIG